MSDPEMEWVHWRLDPVVMLLPDNLVHAFEAVREHVGSPTTAATVIRLTVEALGKGDDTAGAQSLGWSSAVDLYSALHYCVEKTADG